MTAPKEQRPLYFVNKCNCIFDEKELEKAVLWFADGKIVYPRKTINIYRENDYPEIGVFEKTLKVHRLLMMYWEGRKLSPKEHIHHIDGNKLNASRENLTILSQAEHNTLHFKGRPISDELRKIISFHSKKRKGIIRKKRVDIPLNEIKELLEKGYSINATAKHFNVDWRTIKRRINQNDFLREVVER